MVKIVDRYVFKILLVLGLVALIVAAVLFFRSLPPDEFTILTGREGGGYYQAAQEYQKIAAAKGFKLNIQPTAGSVDALDRLEKGEAGVAFIQGGIAGSGDPTKVSSLGAVFYEPVWIFYRKDAVDNRLLKRLTELTGKRIGIGEDGSGTQVLALQMLGANDVTGTRATLESLSSGDAVEKLKSGELDAAFFVASEKSSTVVDLLHTPEIELMDIERADAYAALFPYLRPVTLPQGASDLVNNIPSEPKRLVATATNLVVRNDFHPDLQRLITVAAVMTHRDGGLFGENNEFPNDTYVDLPMNNRARTYLSRIKSGESTLDNYLPFRWAAVAERYMLFVLPLIFLIIPVVTRAPLLYTFWNRWKVNRWYKTVADVERRLPEMDLFQLRQEMAKIQELDDNLLELVNLPNGQLPSAYNLHLHIGVLLQKMQRREEALMSGDVEERLDTPPEV